MPKPTFFGRRSSRRSGPPDSSLDDGSSASIVSDHGGGDVFDGITGSDYARKCRELMRINKDLLDLGAGEMFPLPRVTVIGGQSAGKSSLVEAVSQINVPRDSGTCTRCPMECVMSSSGTSWSCVVSLHIKYDVDGNQIESQKQAFSPEITNPGDVELWIRRAQAAILYHPHRPADEFKNKSADELRDMVKADARRPDSNMAKFSPNMVVVELQDPELTDLFFTDLPGLIQNEEEDVINLVRGLVVDHIGGEYSENNIILITVPMSDDIENQQAVKLARECDPDGTRTIGVLTKPDSLGEGALGARKKWQDVLEDKEHKLKHGYYCVRLPDDRQRLQLTKAEFQREADRYLTTTPPWSQMAVQNRFGVPNLVKDVSKLLVELIESNLPKLKAELDRLLMKSKEELQSLPAPPTSEPIAEVSQMVNNFCTLVKELIVGEGQDKKLVQKDRKVYAKFKQHIWNTSYDFRPFVGHTQYRDPGIDTDEAFNSKDVPSSERLSDRTPTTRTVLDLTDVRQVIVNSIGFELPGHVPFEATKSLVRGATDNWRGPTIACFNSVHDNLWESLQKKISATFKQYIMLEKAISSIVRHEIDSRKDDALAKLEQKVKHETNPLYTQNYHYLSSESAKWNRRYRNVRAIDYKYHVDYKPPAPVSGLKTAAYDYAPAVTVNYSSRVVSSPTPSPTPSEVEVIREEYQDELSLMANVQAYFKVAYKRYVDDIPLLIEHELNQALADRLSFVIFEELFSGDTQKVKDLLAEDPAIARQRKVLTDKIERLSMIKEKLAEF